MPSPDAQAPRRAPDKMPETGDFAAVLDQARQSAAPAPAPAATPAPAAESPPAASHAEPAQPASKTGAPTAPRSAARAAVGARAATAGTSPANAWPAGDLKTDPLTPADQAAAPLAMVPSADALTPDEPAMPSNMAQPDTLPTLEAPPPVLAPAAPEQTMPTQGAPLTAQAPDAARDGAPELAAAAGERSTLNLPQAVTPEAPTPLARATPAAERQAPASTWELQGSEMRAPTAPTPAAAPMLAEPRPEGSAPRQRMDTSRPLSTFSEALISPGLAAPGLALHTGQAPMATTAVSAPLALNQPAFATELGAQVAMWTRQGIQQAELRLNPADMGPVQVSIQVDGTQAQVRFVAELAGTRDALQMALPELALALAQEGLELGSVDVQAQAHPEQPPSFGAGSERGDERRQRHSLWTEEGNTALPMAPPLAQTGGGRRGLLDLYA